ncbi:MurR/RpiR family transcriptional regulator [Nonomuraea sp. NPDC047897]|uniref:MurR/RpiR family transcriptional regulator n=1 Tax=Nonomuraea sp. NPDC047897 TaxID=3364346 RepID=UPI00371907D9
MTGGYHSGLDGLLDGRRLSPVQRRIAHYLSEHLDEAIFLSSVELAERAGVSQPSVTRFAVVLGFAGYPELRQALRPLVLGGAADGSHESLLRGAIDDEIRGLTRLRERLPALPLKELGEALAATEPLPVVGLLASSGPATTLAHFARRIHPDVRLLSHGGCELSDALHAARRAGAEWVLAVVLPPYPADAVRALEYAGKLGLKTAVITDRPDFPAEVVLDAPVGDRPVSSTHAAPLALAMALVEAMAEAAPLRTRARLEEWERMTGEIGTFAPVDRR